MNCILLSPDEIQPDSTTILNDRRFEHIRTVLKAKPGSVLTCGIVDGLLGRAKVLDLTPGQVALSVTFDTPPPPPHETILVCALPRPKSLRKTIMAAVTLGVKNLYFVKTWRVEKSYWQTPLLHPKRMRSLLLEGLEQAVDTIVPTVHLRNRFRPFVEDELPQLINNRYAVVLHPYDSPALKRTHPCPTVTVIGPEGGFVPFEIELFAKAGCTTATLGQRILRVEDAVAAVLGSLSTC